MISYSIIYHIIHLLSKHIPYIKYLILEPSYHIIYFIYLPHIIHYIYNTYDIYDISNFISYIMSYQIIYHTISYTKYDIIHIIYLSYHISYITSHQCDISSYIIYVMYDVIFGMIYDIILSNITHISYYTIYLIKWFVLLKDHIMTYIIFNHIS